MGVLVALQGLKDYWQYIVIAGLLVFIVMQMSWINGLKYEVAKAQVVIEQYQAETTAQEKRYTIAEKEVQIMKKEQDKELQQLQNTLDVDHNMECEKAFKLGVKEGMKIK